MKQSTSWLAASSMGVLLCAPISAQVTQRVSLDSAGAQGNSWSEYPSISSGGAYVAFNSNASNLVPGDTNGAMDVFVRDRQSGTTARVSVATGGAQANNYSAFSTISTDGRYVTFTSQASNLVLGDTNAVLDVFVHNRFDGTTERVSVDSGGVQGNGLSEFSAISTDGRYVVFQSRATDLVPGDTNLVFDIFVRDRHLGTTERVSVDSNEIAGNALSEFSSISTDGRYVAFDSLASNLVDGDTNGVEDVFVRDRQLGTTERISIDSAGAQGDASSRRPSISDDGRYVAFHSLASTLIPGDTNANYDVFVRDRQNGTTERVSLNSREVQANGACSWVAISDNGRFVAFHSRASNLVPGDTNDVNGFDDVFVRDRVSGTTERLSVEPSGIQGNFDSFHAAISADGRFVAFDSGATNLVTGDTNGKRDIFVRDRNATGFTSLCGPGVAGVIACPCSNPPSGAERGCDNSAATGGASLSAAGVAYLSMESLVFTTGGEKPTALSILLQGNAVLPNGVIFGQGVRCAGGSLKRLFAKSAVAGSITAPDFGAGDPTVSARSAAKGDVIQPGQKRWYLVYYRDNSVLGGCSAVSNFNATQTGEVTWSL